MTECELFRTKTVTLPKKIIDSERKKKKNHFSAPPRVIKMINEVVNLQK